MPNDPPPRWTVPLHFGRPDLDLQHQQILILLATFDALAQKPDVTEALHEAHLDGPDRDCVRYLQSVPPAP